MIGGASGPFSFLMLIVILILFCSQGFVPLYQSWESFYTRHVYRRVSDVFCRPVASVPGGTFDVIERHSPDYGWNYE